MFPLKCGIEQWKEEEFGGGRIAFPFPITEKADGVSRGGHSEGVRGNPPPFPTKAFSGVGEEFSRGEEFPAGFSEAGKRGHASRSRETPR